MPTAEKAQTIEQAKEWYSKSVGVIFADYRGLTVKGMQKLRSDLKSKGGEIHVVKNTLFRQAAGQDVVDALPYELHNGPTAIAFVYQNEGECAKVLTDAETGTKILKIKGGYFAGKAFTQKDVVALSKLPPREVLIAQVIGAIAAPLSNLVSVVEALYADPIRVIGAVADKVAEGSPLPTAEAAPAAEPVAEAAPAAEAATPESSSEPVAEEAAPTTETEAPAEEAPAEEPKSE